jgi:hypothetical protein
MAVAPGRQPRGEQPAGGGEPGDEARQREPAAERVTDVGRAGERETGERAGRLSCREPERVRLVCRDPVDPERADAVGVDRRDRQCRPGEQTRARIGIAGCVEVLATGDEHDADERREGRAAVEAVQDVQRGEAEQERDREVVGAPFPPDQAAGEEDQCKPERADERARERVDALRREGL